ncbi:MAG: Glu/Leu/Phe/Val dehydrogenase family protein, partial [bacterium]
PASKSRPRNHRVRGGGQHVKGSPPEEKGSRSSRKINPHGLIQRGGIINDDTIPRFKCKIIAGSANNQLLEPQHGEMLHERGILYAPDYVINAGGLIQVADELEYKDASMRRERVLMKTEAIYDILLRIFTRSKEQNIPTSEVADRLAEERIEVIGKIKTNYVKR